MKKSLFCITLLLAVLTACNQDSESPIDQLITRMTEQPDTINTPGISFDLGDTTMTEDIEEIVYNPQDWEDEPMDADL